MLLPYTPEEFTPELLTGIVGAAHPGTRVEDVKVVKVHAYGDGDVSTSGRATLDLKYGAGAPRDLPGRVVVKMSFDPCSGADDIWCLQLHGLFQNEVNFYNRIRPELDIEAPLSLGGHFDPATKRYMLILEHLGERGAHFPSVLEALNVTHVENVLDTHARLHAHFWESPRFRGDLSWVETHLEGGVETLMRGIVAEGVRIELAKHKSKRELLEWLGTTEKDLFAGMCAVKHYQSTLPQTLIHGDSHVGNTYWLPDGTAGLYDWQCFVRGYAMHDVNYIIITSLSIEQRRKSERDLLTFYRDRLRRYGVANPPDLDTLWREHRRASHWAFYLGWLVCPVESYGWEKLSVALLRLAAAVEDHDACKLVAELL